MTGRLIWVAAGGALGSALRYLLGGWVQTARWVDRLTGGWPVFPWGTLAVNLSGCLAIGLLAGLFEQRLASPGLRLFLLVGVLGGFTTFSTFGLETQRLLEEGSLALAAANAGLSLGGGLLGVLLGLALGRWI